MPRRGQTRARENTSASAAIDKWNLQRILHAHIRKGADPTQKPQRFAVAAEHDVLSVVDRFARVTIAERRCASAEPSTGFDDEDPHTGFRQRRGRAQPGETAADHDHRGPDPVRTPPRSLPRVRFP